MYNFDPYNVLLSIATNIPVLLMTAFVLQGHILGLNDTVKKTDIAIFCFSANILQYDKNTDYSSIWKEFIILDLVEEMHLHRK